MKLDWDFCQQSFNSDHGTHNKDNSHIIPLSHYYYTFSSKIPPIRLFVKHQVMSVCLSVLN